MKRPGFGGPLAGLLAGGLLGALFFGGAFDGINFADVAILALLLGGGWLLLRNLTRGRAAAPPALQGAGGTGSAEPAPQFGRPLPRPVPPAAAPEPSEAPVRRVPADFDEPAFLEQARKAFVRLQSANDSGDRDAIRDFTTPEFFATIGDQLDARRGTPQKVYVTTLNAELLEVASEADQAVASVLFSGFIRESEEGLPQRFEEIWHVLKDLSDPKSSWLLAGIQQVD
jgi:predicted lipid-binding transport protein (Tim44 family)